MNTAALAKYLAPLAPLGLVETWPAPARENLEKLALSFPIEYPKYGMQGSPRIYPGFYPHAVAWAAMPALRKKIEKLMLAWCQWELDNRYAGVTVAQHTDGSGPWLNENGDPVPVTRYDELHATNEQARLAALITDSPVAKAVAEKLINDVIANPICGPGDDFGTATNARGNGWPLLALCEAIDSSPNGAALAPYAGNIIARVERMNGVWQDTPWLMLNAHYQQQADHSFMRCSVAFNAFLTRALGRAAVVLQGVDDSLAHRAMKMFRVGAWCHEYAIQLAKKRAKDGLVGGYPHLPSDYDPLGTANWIGGDALECWTWPALAAAIDLLPERNADYGWDLSLSDAYHAKDAMRLSDKNNANPQLFGLCLGMAARFGWRT